MIVFKPAGSKIHFIKRLIGLPGDEIQMIGGMLHINGAPLHVEKISDEAKEDGNGNLLRSQKYKEYFGANSKSHLILDFEKNSTADDTGVYLVPAGHYFFMGDNRDNSYDSRFPASVGGVGYVPAANLVGRAEFVLLSVNNDFKLFKPWTWANLRGERFFKGL